MTRPALLALSLACACSAPALAQRQNIAAADLFPAQPAGERSFRIGITSEQIYDQDVPLRRDGMIARIPASNRAEIGIGRFRVTEIGRSSVGPGLMRGHELQSRTRNIAAVGLTIRL